MSTETTISRRLEPVLERLRAGDISARDELINIAAGRLLTLTRKLLGDYPRLRTFEESGDIAQNSALRLRQSLSACTPGTVREFLGLAAENIRRELRDLARRHFGRRRADGTMPALPARSPANAAGEMPDDDVARDPDGGLGTTWDPARLSEWTEFHETVEKLPPEEREVVGLLVYQELSQDEAAEVLAVDKSTVKRRWRSARRKLASSLG